jgi:hypothetical protein
VKQLIPAGPYTLGGIPGVEIEGVQRTPDLIWRDNDGSVNIMIPDPEYPEERKRVAQVNTVSFTPKRGTGHKMTEADDPTQMALAKLFCASPDLLSSATTLATALEGVRDDQVSQRMGFGRTAEERAERRRQLAHYIAENADQVDEALEGLFAAIAKASGA